MINKKNILFISIILSIAFSLIIGIYFYKSVFPLELSLTFEKNTGGSDNRLFVHDYDKSGSSEWFEVTNKNFANRAIFLFFKNENNIVDEFSVRGRTELSWNSFEDINGDGRDDALFMSVDNDSLFLTIIDIHTQNYIQKEIFLISRDKKDGMYWDLMCQYIGRIDDDLYLFVASGYSLKPRVFVKYNLTSQKITKSFHVASTFVDFDIIDINNDGNLEIVALGASTGNIPNEQYSDFTSWIFILDGDLNFVVPPIYRGTHPNSSLGYALVSNDNEKNLAVLQSFQGGLGERAKLFLLNNSLKILKTIHEDYCRAKIKTLEINDDRFALVVSNTGEIKLFDQEMNLINREVLKTKDEYQIYISDYNYDGDNEILLISSNNMYLFSSKLEPLLFYVFNETPTRENNHITFNRNSRRNEAGIAINFSNSFKHYAIINNPSYELIPLYIFGIFSLLFILSFISLKGYNKINFAIKRNDFLIRNYFWVIFDLEGKVISKSTRVNSITNVNSLDELLYKLNMKFGKEELIKKLRENNNERIIRQEENLITLLLMEVNRIFHQPVIYLFEEPNKSNRTSEFELWAKSIQKIAHDIKTPISSIMLNLKAIGLRLDKINFEKKDELMSDIEVIQSELNRINKVTRGFLTFTNLDEPKLKITNLRELIDNVIKMFSHYTNNGIEIDIDIEDNFYIKVDDYQFREVFQVLIENAIDSMNASGTIKITAEKCDGDLNDFSKNVMISVTDHGQGIDEKILEKIFDPHFTSKPTGNGLGLPIAKKIIESHKGSIEVYSKSGIGSTFKIFLPLD